MEMNLCNGFCEMSQDEIMEVDGGFWVEAVGIATSVGILAGAANACYDAGVAVGKFAKNVVKKIKH